MDLWRNIKGIFKRGATDTPASSTPSAPVPSTPRTGGYLQYLDFASGPAALNVATAYRCIDLLSNKVACLPLQFMRFKDGIFVADAASRLSYLLNVQPDYTSSAFDFWKQVIIYLLIDGNAYIVPIYNTVSLELDRLVLCGLRTVHHDTLNDTYTVTDVENGITGVFTEKEMIHIKGFSVDGKKGVSVLTYARMTLNIALTGNKETLDRFANGGSVRGIVSNDKSAVGFGEYQDEQLVKTAKGIDDRFRSGERIVSVPGQVDFKQISLSSADMQFLGMNQFTVRDVCRFFGVHPSYVFDDTSNNYKSAEMAGVAFLSDALNPLLRKIECELLRKLVAPSLAHKRKFQFDRRGLYACDLDSRVKYQTATIAAGLYTVNEWRKEENKPPVEGGDTVLVSANLRNITESGTEAQPAPAENKDTDNESHNTDNENETE